MSWVGHPPFITGSEVILKPALRSAIKTPSLPFATFRPNRFLESAFELTERVVADVKMNPPLPARGGGTPLHTSLALENATEQMCPSRHLDLMISWLPEAGCIWSHQRSVTITFNIIIYTHIKPRDRLSRGCLAAISHPPLMGCRPHFITLGCVTLR